MVKNITKRQRKLEEKSFNQVIVLAENKVEPINLSNTSTKTNKAKKNEEKITLPENNVIENSKDNDEK